MTRICWSSTAVVVRGRPDRGRSLTSPVSLQRRMRLLIVAGDTWTVVATLPTDRPDSLALFWSDSLAMLLTKDQILQWP